MEITKRIRLGNSTYYIVVDVEYKKHENNFLCLYLKNYKDSYWDSGDCSLLIEKIEKNYDQNKIKEYDKDILYLGEILYIYDRIPFISGIKEINYSKGEIIGESYISKEELDSYIRQFNIKMHNNDKFKLNDESTWFI